MPWWVRCPCGPALLVNTAMPVQGTLALRASICRVAAAAAAALLPADCERCAQVEAGGTGGTGPLLLLHTACLLPCNRGPDAFSAC